MKFDRKIFDSFNGCIFVKRDKGILFQEAYGYADLSNKIKNQLDTKFPTASAGKVFVAVGILQLIEKGKLSLNTSIGEALKFELGNIDKEVTIEQLLNHTSGVPDYFDEETMDDYDELWKDYPNYKIRKSSDLLPLFINKPKLYPRGQKFQYNNSGFALLGLIIEAITGLLFDEYLRINVFEPIGMLDTGYYELDRLPERCANAYIYDKETKEYYTNIYSVDVKGTGAGGAFTTIHDIEKFWDSLLNYRLLSKNTVKKMMSLQAQSEDKTESYGYGVWLSKDDNGYNPYIEGCDPGVCFVSSCDRNSDTLITAVSNFHRTDVWKIRKELEEIIK